ncbi:MAG: helix-turn-helix domain-containing protein [Clostridiales bacterium]|nr:helix-turn-helix domain-containing protein [Clostridiales bacterium]
MSNLRNESTTRLFETIKDISTVEECYAFFEDLCTIKEIQDMSQRFDTAILLDEGMSYQKIAEKVGVSTATISRVNRCLEYGAGGYRNALDKRSAKEEK